MSAEEKEMQSRQWIQTCFDGRRTCFTESAGINNQGDVHTWWLQFWHKLTKWSFTAHSALWLLCGYLLYVFTLGKHIVYYSHNIHITEIYIYIYTFPPPSVPSVQALPVKIQWFCDRTDQTVATSFLSFTKTSCTVSENVGPWWYRYAVWFLPILMLPPGSDCELQTSDRVCMSSCHICGFVGLKVSLPVYRGTFFQV